MKLFFLLILFFLIVVPTQALYNPLSVPNNKYGMHIADLGDIADVAPLVNSNGGDWGYITLVASDNDRDFGKWQSYFDQMRRLHLIPIVRLATHVEGDHWVKPDPARFEEIVSFFTSLNWPIQNRYIIFYNEPNHAKEWGNEINPEQYAQLFEDFGHKFKEASGDFFLLPAGLDVSAATNSESLDASEYLRRMVRAQPDILNLMDGWTSHSYPNPAFSGSPYSFGRGTPRSYDWELSLLHSLGLTKQLPIFITETGWIRTHDISSETVGKNLQIAAIGAWNDARIVAVTPFVFNYQAAPFDIFSWKRLSRDGGYFPQYEYYKSISKRKGEPLQRERYILTDSILPLALVLGSSYTFVSDLTNTGQGILQPEGYELILSGQSNDFVLISDPLPLVEPGSKNKISIHIKTPEKTGNYRVALALSHHGSSILLQTQDIRIVPPPSLHIVTPLGWRTSGSSSDVTVLVYDDKSLLHTYNGRIIQDGNIRIENLSNILPGRPYRIVVLVPYYLPRQVIQPLSADESIIHIKRLLPLDFNRDGAFTTKDLFALIWLKPNFILSLFVGN